MVGFVWIFIVLMFGYLLFFDLVLFDVAKGGENLGEHIWVRNQLGIHAKR